MTPFYRRNRLGTYYGIRELPSERAMAVSHEQKHDRYYQVPKEIQCFMQRLEKELPVCFVVKPWTINRCVTIFQRVSPYSIKPLRYIDYEAIENNLVLILDITVSWAKGVICECS